MLDKVRNVEPNGHVGFDLLPKQLVRKATKKGFAFNILCIGETGLGKSTLMDTLFNTTFDSTPSPHNLPFVNLKTHTYDLEEDSVQMKLSIIDTCGYGDQVNKEDSFKAIVDYIDYNFEAYLQEELKIRRSLSTYHDSRIHVCLYFICPTGTGLKSIDLVCMKKLDSKVNIIPIIAKSDTISKSELAQFKEKINSELAANAIKRYEFPLDDENTAEINRSLNAHVPFAIVGSNDMIQVGNDMVRARIYPWGLVEIENELHCDFMKLREVLLRTNLEDLRETTHTNHYELYRKTRLEQMGFTDFDNESNPINFQQTYEKKMLSHQADLTKREEEIKQQFILRVKGKEAELKEAERELHGKFDKIKEKDAQDRKKVEDKLKLIEDEMAEFNRLKLQYQTQQLSGSGSGTGHHMLSLGSLGIGKKK